MDTYQRALSAFIDISYSILAPLPSAFPPLEKHPLALEKRLIMHPFLGEMGLEIRGFLGAIDPLLRSGWLIPARRTALYRPGVAFEDPVYFQRVSEIKTAHGLREMTGRLDKRQPTRIETEAKTTEGKLHLEITGEYASQLQPALAARRDLRRAFFERYGHDELLPTKWHSKLSSQCYTDDEFEDSARWAVAPGYLPDHFQNPPFPFQKHIGIQLRNMPQNPSRNSNPERVGRMAAEAAEMLGLPLLMYGREEDFTLPDVPRTIDLWPQGTPQLSAELALLKNCALMISPDSGWTDLMGWLRVPTLLERITFAGGFSGLRPFSPRIVLADEHNIRASIEAVLAPNIDYILPDPMIGEDKADFLQPTGAACKVFWKDFIGQD